MDIINRLIEQSIFQREKSENNYLSYDIWFDEMSNMEVAVIAGYIELLEKDPKKFLERIANFKERESYFNYIYKIESKGNFHHKTDKVQEFLRQVPIEIFLKDISKIAYTFDYIVEKNITHFILGHLEGDEIKPLDEDALQDNQLTYKNESFSLQSIIYFIFACGILHKFDKVRIMKAECEEPEAVYAYAFAQGLQTKAIVTYMIDPTQTYVASTIYTLFSFSKALRFLKDVYEKEEFSEEFRQKTFDIILDLSTKRQQVLFACDYLHLQKKFDKLERAEKNHIAKQNDLQKKLEKQKEKFEKKFNQLQKQNNEAESQVAATAEIKIQDKKLQEENDELKQQLRDAKNELKEEKKKHKKEFDKLLDKNDALIKENERLVSIESDLQKQLVNERRQKLPMEEITFDKWIQKGRELLQELSQTEEDELRGFIALAESLMEERNHSRKLMNLATNRIGYCKVANDGYYINFGDQEWHKISNVPGHVYLFSSQFVEVTKEFEFVQAFNYYFKEGMLDNLIAHFVAVEDRNGEPYARVNGVTTKIIYQDHVQLNDGQLISVNQKNEIVSYYGRKTVTLDDIWQSILLNGHKPVYVMNALENGYVVRDANDKERFVQLEEDLLPHSFIILDENDQITFKDPSGQFLKRSAQYNKKVLASVSEIDKETFVLKENQEYVQLLDVPPNMEFELGDMVWIDEFNRFIELVDVDVTFVPESTIEQKLRESGHKVTKKSPKVQVEKDKELLIIGNIRLSERYKKYFGEYGYEVEVVDGTGPFEKIKQACSKYNTILYSTAFTSHKNSRMMNNEINKPYILCDSTAPKVMHAAIEAKK